MTYADVRLGRSAGDVTGEACVAGDRLARYLPVTSTHDAIDKVEPQACAFAHTLGGKEGLKNARFHFGRNAGTIVGDLHENEIVFPSRTNAQLAIFAHGIGSVVDQVGPHLI